MILLKLIVLSFTLVSLTHVHAASKETAYELVEKHTAPTKRSMVDLPVLLPREHYTTSAERDMAISLVIRASAFEGKEKKEEIKQFLQLLHTAAQFGDPTACREMGWICQLGKYGLSPSRAQMYRDQVKWWQSPEELEAINRKERLRLTTEEFSAGGIAEEIHLSSDERSPTRRSSSDTLTTGSASGDSNDGAESLLAVEARTFVGADTLMGIRHRKPVSKSNS